jgi:predicted TIM-barrel fold metal-dependent hydrolase
MQTMAALAARHADVPVILNHAGMLTDTGPAALDQWRSGMRALAALPHVSAKLSGYGIVNHGWSEASIRPLVLEAIEIFGADRCMFASDFPTDKLFGTFDDWLGAFDAITHDFSADERDALFSANAERIYGIPG